MRRVHHELIEFAIEPHEGEVVVVLCRLVHAAGDALEPRALHRGCPLRAGAAQQPFELAPYLQQQQLVARIDVGNQNALARENGNEPFAGEPLQRLTDRSAPELGGGGKRVLRQNTPRLEPQRNDPLFEHPVGLLGQALRPSAIRLTPLLGQRQPLQRSLPTPCCAIDRHSPAFQIDD